MKPSVVILSAFATPFRSGAEACSEEVAALLKDEFEITVVTSRLRRNLPTEDTLPSGVRLVRVGLGLPFDKWLFPVLGALKVRHMKPQIVHAVLESFAGMALVLCQYLAPTSKRILTCQSTNTSLLLRPMHTAAHRMTAISRVLIERAKKYGREDVTLIPNGMHVAVFEAAREKYHKVPGCILFVGRLEHMKGVDTLLKAVRSVPEAHLHIVGDGSQKKRHEKLAAQLGLHTRVSFAGRLTGEPLLKEYTEAEIFCGLSRSEALGNVFLEAQAAGCAVVATNVDGIPDIVKHDETGLLVAPDAPDETAAILHSLLKDPALRHRLSMNAVQHVKAYDWSVIAPKYAEVYRSLL
jgi:glycosyltransferase involved in cell wall biosynthesis